MSTPANDPVTAADNLLASVERVREDLQAVRAAQDRQSGLLAEISTTLAEISDGLRRFR